MRLGSKTKTGNHTLKNAPVENVSVKAIKGEFSGYTSSHKAKDVEWVFSYPLRAAT
jgi:hypothetical protein